jgi:hypothetical protein
MAKKKNSVQALIGLERFTRYGVKTDKAELVLFTVEPTNVSVLSDSNIGIKIHDLMTVLSVIPDLELIATDSTERFDDNKAYIRQRLEREQNEAVRKLLRADYAFLDEIQMEMSSARQFMFAIRFRREKPEQIFNTLNRVEKTLVEHGFVARRMSRPEIKRMLALYFGTSIAGDEIPDIEGENEFELEADKKNV